MTVEILPPSEPVLSEEAKAALRECAFRFAICLECRDPLMLAIDYEYWERVLCVTCGGEPNA